MRMAKFYCFFLGSCRAMVDMILGVYVVVRSFELIGQAGLSLGGTCYTCRGSDVLSDYSC